MARLMAAIRLCRSSERYQKLRVVIHEGESRKVEVEKRKRKNEWVDGDGFFGLIME